MVADQVHRGGEDLLQVFLHVNHLEQVGRHLDDDVHVAGVDGFPARDRAKDAQARDALLS